MIISPGTGLGKQYTDHHSLALFTLPIQAIEHSAFFTLDWDDLMLGHQHLISEGHRHEWGIGRHIMGSEVFDYWRDPFGHKVEHCTDGDMVNEDTPTANADIADDALAVWSPPISETFMELKV